MDRTIKNPREERFSHRIECGEVKFPVDKQIVTETIIDDSGNVSKIEREVFQSEKYYLLEIPAYTSKIEYIQKYGTLDKEGVIVYHEARQSELDKMIEQKDIEKLINFNIKTK